MHQRRSSDIMSGVSNIIGAFFINVTRELSGRRLWSRVGVADGARGNSNAEARYMHSASKQWQSRPGRLGAPPWNRSLCIHGARVFQAASERQLVLRKYYMAILYQTKIRKIIESGKIICTTYFHHMGIVYALAHKLSFSFLFQSCV